MYQQHGALLLCKVRQRDSMLWTLLSCGAISSSISGSRSPRSLARFLPPWFPFSKRLGPACFADFFVEQKKKVEPTFRGKRQNPGKFRRQSRGLLRSFVPSPAPHHSFGPRVFASPNNTRASPPRGSEADDSGPPPPAAVVLFPIPLPGTPLLAALLSSPPLQTLRKVTEARACAQPPGHAVPRTKRV